MKANRYAMFLALAAVITFACLGCGGKKKDSIKVGTSTGTGTQTLPTGTWPTGTGTGPTGTGTTSTGTGTTSTGTGTTSTGTGTTSTGTGTTSTGTGTNTLENFGHGPGSDWPTILDRPGEFCRLDEDPMLVLINQRRAAAGADPVVMNSLIKAAARDSIDYMMSKCAASYPLWSDKPIEERLAEHGVSYTVCGNTGAALKLASYPSADYASTAINHLDATVYRDAAFKKVGIEVMVHRWTC